MNTPITPSKRLHPFQFQFLGFCLSCSVVILATALHWLNVPPAPRDFWFLASGGVLGAGFIIMGSVWNLWRQFRSSN